MMTMMMAMLLYWMFIFSRTVHWKVVPDSAEFYK